MPKARPIIFSGEMVQALLDGRKTMTRRLVSSPLAKAEAGDLLWVRETHAIVPPTAYRMSVGVEQRIDPSAPHYQAAVYRAGWERSRPGRWKPSIHMPRWASRLTLRVLGKDVHPLQETWAWMCLAEGAPAGMDIANVRSWFAGLWDDLHGQQPNGWACNPDVVALSFEVIRRNIDEVLSDG